MKREDYPYLYETHLHTSESSACAQNTGREMAEACKKAGYTGIIVTDHNWYGNTCIDRSLSWERWVDEFCRGYEHAKSWGDENDLQVFFGYESCYRGTEFLIYGVDRQWLCDHPEIKDASIEEQYELIHEAKGMVIQAHPFRKEDYIPEIRLFPQWVDGAEGINATHSCHLSTKHNDPKWDEQATAYSLQYGLPMTAGSDVHSTLIFGGGVAFQRKLTSIADFCNAILSGEDYLLTNGDAWFDKKGERL
ncbi:MAG: PHP-associated domain-containing protein [Suilimivivens sp.]